MNPHLQFNFDDACFMYSDGIMRIVGYKERTHHNNNMADGIFSTTVIRFGNAGGFDGLFFPWKVV